jgi:HCOMODA/2-hydroxy-3-carboxy-muconic semialdehyde decarboxylase
MSNSLIADLAAASRILAAHGVVDAFGHVSLRHPTAPDRYLMARAVAPALVTPGDIIEYDCHSNALNADGRGSFLERFIHGEIYKTRPDVHSVVHSHSPSVIPFGLVGVPMQAMFHNAAFIAAGVPVFDIHEKFGATDMLVGNPAKGAALAAALGSKDIVLMRAHGSVACGPTLERAVFRAVYTEINARIQHWTMALALSRESERIAALDAEEGRLADAINEKGCMRAWELWREEVRSRVNW